MNSDREEELNGKLTKLTFREFLEAQAGLASTSRGFRINWAKQAIKSGSYVNGHYRSSRADVETVLVNAAKDMVDWGNENEDNATQARDWLRLMRQFLLRRHATRGVRLIDQRLADLREPATSWTRLDLCMPRLFMGVLAGFLTLGASSNITEYLQRACDTWIAILILAINFVLVGFMAVAEVRRTAIGVADWGRRSWKLFGFGILFALTGAVVLWCFNWFLHCSKRTCWQPVYWRFCWLCGAVALTLGFVLYLFTQERSIGDPVGEAPLS